MADTTLLLNGFSIIGDPHTNTNASQGGNLMIHGGSAVFEGDDIIVFLVEGATEDGVLTDDSVIVGVIVYDNASDYLNDVHGDSETHKPVEPTKNAALTPGFPAVWYLLNGFEGERHRFPPDQRQGRRFREWWRGRAVAAGTRPCLRKPPRVRPGV